MVKKMLRISTKKKIGFRISDIGPGGKESNIRTDEFFDKKERKNRK